MMPVRNGALINVVIVDDEPVARQTIRLLLNADPELAVVGECTNGQAAVELLRKVSPDLVFLDVQMPGLSGFDVLKSLRHERLPAVIFTTAYDTYAIRAFEVHALDYILKPFDDDRFREAVSHAKSVIVGNRVEDLSRQLVDLIERFDLKDRLPLERHPAQDECYLTRLMIRSSGRVVIVDVDTVEWIEAEGNYVSIHAGGKKHLLREKISSLEAQLDPSRFARIHRSTIVRTDRIKTMTPLFNGDHVVKMTDGREFTLSRTYREHLLSALGKPV